MNLTSNFLIIFTLKIFILLGLNFIFISSDEIKQNPNPNSNPNQKRNIKKAKRRIHINKNEFQKFKRKFNKHYDKITEIYRINVFNDNLIEIEKLNKKAKEKGPKQSVFFGVNLFSDISKQNFRKKHLGFNFNHVTKLTEYRDFKEYLREYEKDKHKLDKEIKAKNLISTKSSKLKLNLENYLDIDPRKTGLINEPTNQGDCGCCWAFSSAYAIECIQSLRVGKKIILSPQEIIDCTPYTNGCDGGNPYYAFAHAQKTGLTLNIDYPYNANKGTCIRDQLIQASTHPEKSKMIKVSSYWYYTDLPQYESWMITLLQDLKSFVIAINGDHIQNYVSGVLDLNYFECNPENVNHAVTLVGYSEENGQKVWIIKNSWGPYWGENGYIRVAFGKNVCGVCKYAFCARLV